MLMENYQKSIIEILNVIENEAIRDIENNPQLTVLNKKDLGTFVQMGRIGLIDFVGDITISILFCIEEELFQTCFHSCFKTVEEDEREELEDAFPDEMINLIVGLSIRHFPKELDDFTLSVPYELSADELDTIFKNETTITRQIFTNKGILQISLHINGEK